ncbi:rab-3-interacting molecule unc-10-like isoform X1 [Eurosta solidaginis]|uniref:rab-3-interacting molecule unc-10-like isoform X1 n=1 Tax=Eurosta solidaginis TaxID=178769 RepID=UPI003530888F
MALQTNTNRLNFPNMVNRQINVNMQPISETYFNPLVITGKRKPLEERESKRAEISTSFNNIIASVHNKLRSTQQVYLKARNLDEAKSAPEELRDQQTELESPKTLPNQIDNSKSHEANVVKTRAKANIQKPPASRSLKRVSIPQIKANRASKQLQSMRRIIPQIQNYEDPLHQKRIIEVRQQKQILEDMLKQHQRLQRDRQSIAIEIQLMREHLNDIRHKLDLSFKRLTTKPIACSEVLAKPNIGSQQWRGSFTRKPPLATAPKLPASHSILKVTKDKSAISTTKSINKKLKSASSSAVQNGPRQNSPVQNKNNTNLRPTSVSRSKKEVEVNDAH